MSLTIDHRTIGDVAVLTCRGRIVEGSEAADLDRRVRALQLLHRDFVLDLRDVSFVDSAGLGLLVRLLARLRAASSDLKLCGVAPNIQKSLIVSRLNTVLPAHESVEAAIEALYAPVEGQEAAPRGPVEVLCVHPSSDVLAYLHELMRRGGYRSMAVSNVSDAAILLRATQPSVVVIDGETRRRGMSEAFERLILDTEVIELTATFATEDPGEAGQRLLTDVSRVVPARA